MLKEDKPSMSPDIMRTRRRRNVRIEARPWDTSLLGKRVQAEQKVNRLQAAVRTTGGPARTRDGRSGGQEDTLNTDMTADLSAR